MPEIHKEVKRYATKHFGDEFRSLPDHVDMSYVRSHTLPAMLRNFTSQTVMDHYCIIGTGTETVGDCKGSKSLSFVFVSQTPGLLSPVLV